MPEYGWQLTNLDLTKETNFVTDFTSPEYFIKNNKITHVVYNNCLNIIQLDLIKNYFETNNLVLEVIKK